MFSTIIKIKIIELIYNNSVDNYFLDSVTKNTTLLLLSETWTNNNPAVGIPNFNCVAQFHRTNAPPAAGVAIYKNNNDETNVLTPNIDVQLKNTSDINVRHTNVGDICSTICKMENGLEIVIAVIYISPQQKVLDIIKFIRRSLLEYTKEGSRLIEENFHEFRLF